jgi:hypothetical protein
MIVPSSVTTSTITIGGFDSSMMSTNYLKVNYEPVINTTRWTLKVSDVRMGLYSFKSTVGVSAVLDSFYPVILIPNAEY